MDLWNFSGTAAASSAPQSTPRAVLYYKKNKI